jgi:hypothetical protein
MHAPPWFVRLWLTDTGEPCDPAPSRTFAGLHVVLAAGTTWLSIASDGLFAIGWLLISALNLFISLTEFATVTWWLRKNPAQGVRSTR